MRLVSLLSVSICREEEKARPVVSGHKKILIVAGEPSGELLGAQLMQALRKLSDVPIRFSGVGGEHMARAGLYSFFPMSDIALMGAAEILPRLRNIFRRMNTTAEMAARTVPDLVVLIDSPEFNLRLAKRIRKKCPDVPVALYVAPQVWASRPGRARKMSKFVDHIFALLPFEQPFFENAGIPCTIVGHPVIERKKLVVGGADLRRKYQIPGEAPLVCLLPGSRFSEVKRLLPIFGEVASRLTTRFPEMHFVIPTVPHVREYVCSGVASWSLEPIMVESETDKFAAFDASDVALAASGTVSLELALARVPTVIAYKVDPVTAFVARRIITTKYANLVNLIVDHAAIPELIQQDCTPEKLTKHVGELVSSSAARDAQLKFIDEATSELGLGDKPPSVRAAEAIMQAFIREGAPAVKP